MLKYKTIIGDKKIREAQRSLGNRTWPEFMQHDSVVTAIWPRLYTDFPDFQFASYSEDTIVGVGNSIPLYWEDEFERLPLRGLDWAMEKAVKDLGSGQNPNMLVGVQILINPDLQSRGLSYEFLTIMKEIARSKGFRDIALPVRPTKKHLFPLIPIGDYIHWSDKNSLPFDPWLRVHMKAGGRIAAICDESMKIEGSISEWEEWTGQKFRSSGQYLVEGALCPVRMDIDKNIGRYMEPNVWVVHHLD